MKIEKRNTVHKKMDGLFSREKLIWWHKNNKLNQNIRNIDVIKKNNIADSLDIQIRTFVHNYTIK